MEKRRLTAQTSEEQQASTKGCLRETKMSNFPSAPHPVLFQLCLQSKKSRLQSHSSVCTSENRSVSLEEPQTSNRVTCVAKLDPQNSQTAHDYMVPDSLWTQGGPRGQQRLLLQVHSKHRHPQTHTGAHLKKGLWRKREEQLSYRFKAEKAVKVRRRFACFDYKFMEE